MRTKITMLLLAALAALMVSCERVEPNYAGVLMTNYGKNGKTPLYGSIPQIVKINQ